MGVDPATLRPRIAKGIVAIGNVAVGGVAIAGLACGLISIGGASFGLLFALGGAAVGLGVSVGGLAIGSVAVGGAAIGFACAIGGGAFGPAIIDGRRGDSAAVELVRRRVGTWALPPSCRQAQRAVMITKTAAQAGVPATRSVRGGVEACKTASEGARRRAHDHCAALGPTPRSATLSRSSSFPARGTRFPQQMGCVAFICS